MEPELEVDVIKNEIENQSEKKIRDSDVDSDVDSNASTIITPAPSMYRIISAQLFCSNLGYPKLAN